MVLWGLWFPSLLVWSVGMTYAQDFPTQCYFRSDNTNHTSPGGPCGVVSSETDYFTCCAVGDTCLDDGICYYTHAMPTNGGTSTGYYVGGTTDPNLQINFNTACDDLDLTDIVYNNGTEVWQCCGSEDKVVHCADPTTETFSATAPWLMTATYTVPSTVVMTSISGAATTQTTASSTPTPTPALSSTNSSPTTTKSSRLSLASEAGIAVGASIVALSIILSAIYILQRRTWMHSHPSSSSSTLSNAPLHAFPWSEKDVGPYRKGGLLSPHHHSRYGAHERDHGVSMSRYYTGRSYNGRLHAMYPRPDARPSPNSSNGSPNHQGRFLEDLLGTVGVVEICDRDDMGGRIEMDAEKGRGKVESEVDAGKRRMPSELETPPRIAGGVQGAN